MRVLGNLHIDVAAATSLTPLGAGQAPCIRKRLFSTAPPFAESVPWAEIHFQAEAVAAHASEASSPGHPST